MIPMILAKPHALAVKSATASITLGSGTVGSKAKLGLETHWVGAAETALPSQPRPVHMIMCHGKASAMSYLCAGPV